MNKSFLGFYEGDEEFCPEENAKIIVLPIPYDGTSTWIKGSDNGPEAILNASANMEIYDIETDSEVYKQGIYTVEPVLENQSPETMVAAAYQRAASYLSEDKFLLTLGGEHSVSIGVIQAFAEKFPNLTVLQFDAHSDTREQYHGSKNNHACVMARVREAGIPMIQVGIRSMDAAEKEAVDSTRMFYAHQIKSNPDWQQQVLDLLTENVYITIDLDVFDPSIMSSVGTPEPDGLLYRDVLDMVKKVNEKANIVGFDAVELCPNSANKAPDFTAAKLIHQMLSFKFQTEKI